jgi:predicted amidohydrolase YtcJ
MTARAHRKGPADVDRNKASLVFRGGNILTLDERNTRATAIAVREDQIVHVGNQRTVKPFIDADTRVVELDGRTVVPGFNDAHAHMDREGLKSQPLSLVGCNCIADVLGRIRNATAMRKPGEWIVAMPVGEPPHYFNGLATLSEGRMPTRIELDAVAPENPVYIQGVFGNWGLPPGHSALNSKALQLNNIGPSTTPRVAGVAIEKSSSGEPTGVIVENNPRPSVEFDFLKAVPRFTLEQRIEGIRDSMRAYNAVGTTSVYEGHGVSASIIAAYRHLWERESLTVRTGLVLSPTWGDFEEATRIVRDWLASARGRGLGDRWLSVSGVHIAWGGDRNLAALSRGDLPNTGWSGFVEQANSPAEFRDYCFLLAEHGLRLNTIVTDSLRDIIPIIEEVARRYPLARERWVIQHLARCRNEDLRKVKALGLEVTTIPAFTLWKGGHKYLSDPDGGESIAPHRSLLDLEIPTAAGTDNIPYNPLFTLWVMAERRERTTNKVLGRNQRLSNEQALRMLTTAGARLTFDEGIKGTLKPGCLADLTVLSDDPTAVPGDELRRIKAQLTMVGGRVVYEM